MRIRKAVIPAAGLGTRFLPATKAQPKEMLPIVDKPAIQYIVEEAVAAGIEQILIITGRGKRAIEDHFDKSFELESILREKEKNSELEVVERISEMAEIFYVRQKEAKGLGHAVHCAEAFVGNEPFAVLLGDDIVVAEKPCIRQMMDIYEQMNQSVIAVQHVPEKDVSSYGIVSPDGKAGDRLTKVLDLVEKPSVADALSDLAIIGRYVLSPDIFSILRQQQPGSGGEIQLTDALRVLNRGVKGILAYEFAGKRYDIGNTLGYLTANIEFGLERGDIGGELRSYLKGLLKAGL